jgi:hypothetical protein
MSGRNRRRHGSHADEASQQHRPNSVGGAPRWRLTPLKIGIGLGVVVIGGAYLLGAALRRGDADVLPDQAVNTFQPGSAQHGSPNAMPQTTAGPSQSIGNRTTMAGGLLPPPPPGVRVPVNNTDPVTGKPIEPTSPTLPYKGYTIAFCCEQSEGYRGAWARMSDMDKDAFVLKCLR